MMQEQVNHGILWEAPEGTSGDIIQYITHQAVIKDHEESTKICGV